MNKLLVFVGLILTVLLAVGFLVPVGSTEGSIYCEEDTDTSAPAKLHLIRGQTLADAQLVQLDPLEDACMTPKTYKLYIL